MPLRSGKANGRTRAVAGKATRSSAVPTPKAVVVSSTGPALSTRGGRRRGTAAQDAPREAATLVRNSRDDETRGGGKRKRRKPPPLGEEWICTNCDHANGPIRTSCMMCGEAKEGVDSCVFEVEQDGDRAQFMTPAPPKGKKRRRKASDSWQEAVDQIVARKRKARQSWSDLTPCHCPHINSMQCNLVNETARKRLLQPDNWCCVECATTESIWACLHCGYVGCGRTMDSHAIKHAKATDHFVVMELNSKYVHCYKCEDFVSNDTPLSDFSELRDSLTAVEEQRSVPLRTRSGLKVSAVPEADEPSMTIETARQRDILQTAIFRWKSGLLFRAFNTWRDEVQAAKDAASPVPVPARIDTPKRQASLHAGLRNLGNTCYMNAVLQSLAHTPPFRVGLQDLNARGLLDRGNQQERKKSLLKRRTTVDCRDLVEKKPQILSEPPHAKVVTEQIEDITSPELCREFAALNRVLMSGKFSIVTPLAMQGLLWRIKPDFRGYAQQDAQELLLAYQERWEAELTKQIESASMSRQDQIMLRSVIGSMRGDSIQTVTCGHCRVETTRRDTFSDVSLDLSPEGQKEYDLIELIKACSTPETIEGFHCDSCSVAKSGGSRRSSRAGGSAQKVAYRTAEKKVEIAKPAQVMRFHLKRFVWAGVRRHKVRAKVHFPFELNMADFVSTEHDEGSAATTYALTAIICHQGLRMTSGHFYAHCKTSKGDWMCFNDRKVSRESEADVQKDADSAGYILIYTRT